MIALLTRVVQWAREAFCGLPDFLLTIAFYIVIVSLLSDCLGGAG